MGEKKVLISLLIFTLYILFLNIYFLIKFKINSSISFFSLKNIDLFLINYNSLLKKTSFNFSQNMKSKKIINVFFEDVKENNIKNILKILKKKYIVNMSENKPDYLIYNVFGCNHLKTKYRNSIKIAFFTENQIPDFSVADYAFGQSHITFLDRYFKNPDFVNLIKNITNSDLQLIRKKVIYSPKRKNFCAAVISNSVVTDYFRLKFIKELNKYKRVDMGGKYLNNVGNIRNKIQFLSSYKFSIAMENTEGDGYLTEKILDSFKSGTIPIYYGDYLVDEYINPKSYILIRGEEDMIQKIEYIKKIDKDNKLYKSILKENILNNEKLNNKNYIEFEEFFFHIFEQNKQMAKRVDNIINNIS